MRGNFITPRKGSQNPNYKDGRKGTRLYRIYRNMFSRCYNPKTASYARYGGRGVRVCDEWKDYSIFETWARTNGYSDELSIDRIDFNSDYSPDNCRWVDAKTQARNTSRTRFITIGEETKSLIEWTEIFDLNYRTVSSRIAYGWDFERALFTPTKTPFLKEGGFQE